MGGKIHAQAMYGTTGLLHAPTAEMQKDKTILIGGSMIDPHKTASEERRPEMDTKITSTYRNYYTNQMNIVLFVDVKKILRTKSAKDSVWFYDNTGHSEGNGTTQLISNCKPGTVVNWLVYSLDMERKPDGTWPAVAEIWKIVFLDPESEETSRESPFEELKIYVGPDKIRSLYTSVYSYWSGNIRMDIGKSILLTVLSSE